MRRMMITLTKKIKIYDDRGGKPPLSSQKARKKAVK